MADNVLIAEPRSERGSGAAGRLRRAGRLPAVVYGLHSEVAAVTVPTHDLSLILSKGANTLITLRVDGEDQLALARQVQRHPVRGELVHVDFVRVRRDVAISAEVPIVLTGEPEGVRDGGMLEQQMFHVTVEANPQDIPGSLEIDVSHLALGDHVRLSDLTFPPRVTTAVDADTLVATVSVPRGLAAEEGEEVEGEAAEGEGAEGEASAAEGGSSESTGE